MNAEILMIGPFNQNISDCLDYPQDCYKDTELGTIVVCRLFICNTRNESLMLADMFGVESDNFNTHPIKTKNVKLADLRKYYLHSDVNKFAQLIKSGFAAVYIPNY